MKYAFMSFSCPDLPLEEMLMLAHNLGYDGIEPRIGENHRHGVEVETDVERRIEIRRQVEASGVALCCLATPYRYADAASAPEQIARTRRAIDLAADVGAPRLRVFGGQIPDGMTREQAIAQVARSLKGVADYAHQRRVLLCLETHDDWCDPEHVAEVMRRVDHAAVAVNWDVMHPVFQAGKTVAQAFQTLRPWIRHVHVHDGIRTNGVTDLQPIGQGDIDHRAAVRLLRDSGYDGYLSGEWINWRVPYSVHLSQELATLKAYELQM